MNKESHKYIERGLSIASLLVIAQALLGAFSINTKNQIRDRVRRKHGKLISEVSGEEAEYFEAAHINHDKRNPNYDKAFNGVLMTVAEHYDDHVNNHGKNGLHPLGNMEALGSIWKRLNRAEKEGRMPPEHYAETLLEEKHLIRWRIQKNKGKSIGKQAKSS